MLADGARRAQGLARETMNAVKDRGRLRAVQVFRIAGE
jgi:hypothetical protein